MLSGIHCVQQIQETAKHAKSGLLKDALIALNGSLEKEVDFLDSSHILILWLESHRDIDCAPTVQFP